MEATQDLTIQLLEPTVFPKLLKLTAFPKKFENFKEKEDIYV
jgi:hypothetical protein